MGLIIIILDLKCKGGGIGGDAIATMAAKLTKLEMAVSSQREELLKKVYC